MPNGRPGDHPLTDLLTHGRTVYGPEVDACLREIAALSTASELDAWWLREIATESDSGSIRAKVEEHLRELRSRQDPHRQKG